ncbi:MAG: hypothetical protein V4722_09695 [Bacteroidota bacterium]
MKENWLAFRIAVMISFSVGLLIFVRSLYNLATGGLRMQALITNTIVVSIVLLWLVSIAFQALNLRLLQHHFSQQVMPSATFWQWYRVLFVLDCIAVLLLFVALGAYIWVIYGYYSRYPGRARNYYSLSSLSFTIAMLVGNICNCFTLLRSPAFIKSLKTAAHDRDQEMVNRIGEEEGGG